MFQFKMNTHFCDANSVLRRLVWDCTVCLCPLCETLSITRITSKFNSETSEAKKLTLNQAFQICFRFILGEKSRAVLAYMKKSTIYPIRNTCCRHKPTANNMPVAYYERLFLFQIPRRREMYLWRKSIQNYENIVVTDMVLIFR